MNIIKLMFGERKYNYLVYGDGNFLNRYWNLIPDITLFFIPIFYILIVLAYLMGVDVSTLTLHGRI